MTGEKASHQIVSKDSVTAVPNPIVCGRGSGKMKLMEPQARQSERQNSCQQMDHVMLQTFKGDSLLALGFQQKWVLISASALPNHG